MADRLYTSSEADEVLSALRFETKLEKATLARIAFTLSLVKDGAGVVPSPSFSGGELKRPTFIAEDEVFLRTLIAHTYGKREFSEDEFFSNRSIVKNHIDSGAALLAKMFQETGRSGDALIQRLVDEVEFAGRREQLGSGLDISIWPHLIAADRANHGAEQHDQACQFAFGDHGQARRRQDPVLAQNPDRHSHPVEFPDEFHLLRLQG